ncbi:MAG: hypothetical protein ABH886_07190 [Candidatus Desantisbacteria bacterium]
MVVYLYLICGIIIGCLFTWLFLQRRSTEITMSSDEGGAFRDNVSKLITEFNKISNANINTLEDKIQDIREVIELADERIVRINSSLSDIGIVARRMKEKPVSEKEEALSLVEIVSLSKKKYQPAVDISLPAALPLSEDEAEGERRHRGTENEEIASMVSVAQPESYGQGQLPEVLPPPSLQTLRDIKKEAQRHKGAKVQSVQLPEVLFPIPEFSKKKAKPKKEKEEEKPTITPLPKTATKEEKIETINELLSAGFSVEDISRAVELSQTEVQLILGLKKKRL